MSADEEEFEEITAWEDIPSQDSFPSERFSILTPATKLIGKPVMQAFSVVRKYMTKELQLHFFIPSQNPSSQI